MLDVVFVALGFVVIALMAAYAVGSASALRRPTMIEPIFGLIVAVGLGLYLLYTLLRPEKF